MARSRLDARPDAGGAPASHGDGRLSFALAALLRPYAQIVFARDLISGALVLAAIATFPRLAAATLVAVALAQAASFVFGLGVDSVREGGGACVAILTTLVTAAYSPDGATWPLVAMGAVLSIVFTAAFQAMFVKVSLPTHSLPFVAAAWTVNLTTRVLPPSIHPVSIAEHWSIIPASFFEPAWLDVPAAILFVHGAIAGALVLLAIAWHSRIAVLLAGIGGLVAWATGLVLRPGVAWSAIDLTASFNGVLVAMAIGGVWFVPHPTSILLGAAGSAIACVITYALFPVLSGLSLPVLSLPFVLTTILILTATRMREHDRWPASSAYANRPEEALERHLMRTRRFGEFAWLPFRLPFRGTWVVTQGHGGAHTHKGPWRHAFDFETLGPDGRAFEHDGRELRDYRCYGLPVLAPGAGTVEQVIDGVADNAVGEVNARDNWGNVVVIAHASGLHSVCSHLQPRSIRVKKGDLVSAGTEIGRCGNSGRSLVPHLHFQVQRGAALGSATVPADFGDVVSGADGRLNVAHRVIPEEGQAVRPVMRDEAIARALAFAPGSAWAFVDTETRRREIGRVEIDFWGRRVLHSPRASLYLEPYESGLVIVAFDGHRDSLLRNLLLALARVPFDQQGSLTWSDRVPRRLTMTWPTTLVDLVAVIAPGIADAGITYTSRRTERALVVTGAGEGLSTSATIALGGDPHTLSVERQGRTTSIEIHPLPAGAEEA